MQEAGPVPAVFVLALSGEAPRLKDEEARMPVRTKRNEKLDLRLTHVDKLVLKAAAEASRRSVSQFVLESALSRAEEALADRRSFGLNAKQWKAFLAALDAPPRTVPRIERLM